MKGASAALRRFSALDGKARQALRHACDAAARDTLSQARAAVPVRSGRLRASLAVSSLENGMKVTASAPYAILIEQGGGRSPAAAARSSIKSGGGVSYCQIQASAAIAAPKSST